MAIDNLNQLIAAATTTASTGVRQDGTSVNSLRVNPIADTLNKYATGLTLREYRTQTAYLVNEYVGIASTQVGSWGISSSDQGVYKVIRAFTSVGIWAQDQTNLQRLSYQEYSNKESQLVPEVTATLDTVQPVLPLPELTPVTDDDLWAQDYGLLDFSQGIPPADSNEFLGNIRANIYADDSSLLVSSDLGTITAEAVKGSFPTGQIVDFNSTTGRIETLEGVDLDYTNITAVDISATDILSSTVDTTNINGTLATITTVSSTTDETLHLKVSVDSYLGLVKSGIWNGSILGVAYGGTGSGVTSGVGGALDNLLPSGESAGYVLKTSGAGSYYWAAETGGAATVGTKIDTQRVEYTATAGQTLFTGVPTYVPGAGQLRVYITGVRQNPSAYTETSSTSFTLSAGVPVGTQVFAEVDGYVSYPITATDIAYSPLGGGTVTAVDVQAAIEEIDTEKAPLANPAFTGIPTAPTASAGTNTTQIATTAFVVNNAIPSGGVIMWSGAILAIPTGWALCDGTNGTPDLRNKFIIGAGADNLGIATTNITGTATQTGGTKDAIVVSHTHTGTTNTTGAHVHGEVTSGGDVDTGTSTAFQWVSGTSYGPSGPTNSPTNTQSAGDHSHTLTIDSAGSSGTNANIPPYYALAFIMKL